MDPELSQATTDFINEFRKYATDHPGNARQLIISLTTDMKLETKEQAAAFRELNDQHIMEIVEGTLKTGPFPMIIEDLTRIFTWVREAGKPDPLLLSTVSSSYGLEGVSNADATQAYLTTRGLINSWCTAENPAEFLKCVSKFTVLGTVLLVAHEAKVQSGWKVKLASLFSIFDRRRPAAVIQNAVDVATKQLKGNLEFYLAYALFERWFRQPQAAQTYEEWEAEFLDVIKAANSSDDDHHQFLVETIQFVNKRCPELLSDTTDLIVNFLVESEKLRLGRVSDFNMSRAYVEGRSILIKHRQRRDLAEDVASKRESSNPPSAQSAKIATDTGENKPEPME